MTVVSDVEIRLRADIARLRQDLQGARREVTGALNSMSASAEAFKGLLGGIAAGLTVGAFVSFIKNSIDAADALNDMSARTKVAIEDLAGLAYAAKLGDTSLEGVASSITKLGQNIGKEGAKFRALGITATEPLEAFKQLADVFKDIKDPQQRAAFGAEALGKSWQEAAVLLEGGSEGIATLIGRGKELSGITEQVAADAGIFNDKLDELGTMAQGVGMRIAADLLPMLNLLVQDMSATGTEIDSTVEKFNPLTEILRVIVILGGNVAFVLKGIATEIGTFATQIGEYYSAIGQFAKLDFSGGWATLKATFGEGGLGDQASAAAADARAAFDKWEESWVNVGTAADRESKRAEAAGNAMADALIANFTGVGKAAGDSTAKVAAFLNAAEIKAARDKAAAAAQAAIEKEKKAYAGLVTSIKEKIAADEAEIAGGRALTDAQKLRIKIDQELASGKIDLTAEHLKEIRALLDDADAMGKNAAAAKQVRDAVAALADERDKNYQGIVDEARANEELVATYGKTKLEIARVTLARDEDRLSQRAALDLSEDTVAQLEREIEARKRNIAAMGSLEVLDKQKKASEEAAAAQVDFWKSIDSTAHDTFVSILNGSKSTAQRLKDTFKNVFFDWLYQQTIKKWFINVGMVGTTSVAGAAESLAGGGSGGGSLISIGKSIYDGFSNGFMGAAGSLGSAISSLGSMFGSEAISAFGAGLQGGALGAGTASAASGYAGTTAAGYGAAAAPYVGALAGVAGGIYGGRALSGGYSAFGGSGNTAVNIGTAIGTAILPGIGSLVGGLIGGAVNRAFGMGPKTATGSSIEGTLSPTGATGNNLTSWTQKGGWFRSNKSGVDSNPLTGEQSALFTTAYKGILDLSKVLGDTVGADTAGLATRLQKLSIDFKGLTTDAEKGAAVTKFFEGVANTIAGELVPNLAQFAKEGEATSTTLMRLAQDYASVDAILKATGQAIKTVGAAGIESRENLIAAAGGLDALAGGVSYFQQNFYSDADKLAAAQTQVSAAMTSLGQSAVTTNEQFKAAVLGIDLSTKAGAELYVQMLALAPAFKTVADAQVAAQAEQIAQAKAVADALAAVNKGYDDQIAALLAAREGAAAVRAFEIRDMDATTVARYDYLKALQAEDAALASAAEAAEALAKANEEAAKAAKEAAAGQARALSQMLKEATGSALDDLQRSVGAQRDANKKAFDELMASIGASIDTASGKVSELQDLAGALRGGVATGAASTSSARAALAAAAQVARVTGVLPKASEITDALNAVRGDNSDLYGSLIEYQRAAAATNNDIADLAGATDTQLSVAQSSLRALQEQKAAAQAAYEIEDIRLGSLITTAQASLDRLNGIYTGILSLPDALANIAATIKAAMANPGAAQGSATQAAYSQYLGRAATPAEVEFWKNQAAKGTDVTGAVAGSDEARIQALYQKYLGRVGEQAGVNLWENAVSQGQSWSSIEAAIAGSDEARARDASMVSAIDNLSTQMAGMQSAMNRTASSTGQLADQFSRVSGNGNALLTETA